VIEIIQEYWKSLLWTDGYRFTGVAITLWLLISSVVMGGILAVFLAIGRVSNNKFIQFPIWLFTYVFRGTPLYVQLLVFYSGMYTLEIVKGSALAPHMELAGYVMTGIVAFLMCIQAKHLLLSFVPGTFIGACATFAGQGDWKLVVPSLLLGLVFGYAMKNSGLWIAARRERSQRVAALNE